MVTQQNLSGLSLLPEKGIAGLELRLKIQHKSKEAGGQPEKMFAELRNANDFPIRLVYRKRYIESSRFPIPGAREEPHVCKALWWAITFELRPVNYSWGASSQALVFDGSEEWKTHESELVLEAGESIKYVYSLGPKSPVLLYKPVRSGRYRMFALLRFENSESVVVCQQFPEYRKNGLDLLPGATRAEVIELKNGGKQVILSRGQKHGVLVGDEFREHAKGSCLCFKIISLDEETCLAEQIENKSAQRLIKIGEEFRLGEEGPRKN